MCVCVFCQNLKKKKRINSSAASGSGSVAVFGVWIFLADFSIVLVVCF